MMIAPTAGVTAATGAKSAPVVMALPAAATVSAAEALTGSDTNDVRTPDARMPDTRTPDARTLDGRALDGRALDAPTFDALMLAPGTSQPGTTDSGLARFFEVLRHTGDQQAHAKADAVPAGQPDNDEHGDEPALLPGMAMPMWLGLASPMTMAVPVILSPPSASSGTAPADNDVGAATPLATATATRRTVAAPPSGAATAHAADTTTAIAPRADDTPADAGAPTRADDTPARKSALSDSMFATPGRYAVAGASAGMKTGTPAGAQAVVSADTSTKDGAAPASPRDRAGTAAPTAAPTAATAATPLAWANDQAAMAASNAGTTAVDTRQAMTLALPADAPARWRQPLAEALGDRLQLQLGRGSDHAVIRLDPPSLGRIDISIRHDAVGGLQIQLSASNSDVLRQLHALGDTLRQDLVHRQYGEVAVLVSDSRREGDARQRPGQPETDDHAKKTPGRALTEADAGLTPAAFNLSRD